MKRKKFAQDISDILSDDLDMLERLEPGAILRPESPARQPEPGSTEPEPAEPGMEATEQGDQPAPEPEAGAESPLSEAASAEAPAPEAETPVDESVAAIDVTEPIAADETHEVPELSVLATSGDPAVAAQGLGEPELPGMPPGPPSLEPEFFDAAAGSDEDAVLSTADVDAWSEPPPAEPAPAPEATEAAAEPVATAPEPEAAEMAPEPAETVPEPEVAAIAESEIAAVAVEPGVAVEPEVAAIAPEPEIAEAAVELEAGVLEAEPEPTESAPEPEAPAPEPEPDGDVPELEAAAIAPEPTLTDAPAVPAEPEPEPEPTSPPELEPVPVPEMELPIPEPPPTPTPVPTPEPVPSPDPMPEPTVEKPAAAYPTSEPEPYIRAAIPPFAPAPPREEQVAASAADADEAAVEVDAARDLPAFEPAAAAAPVEPLPALPRAPRDEPETGAAGEKYAEITDELARRAGQPHKGTARRQHFSDAVTLLEIAPEQSGGVRERRLPGDRAQSPPSPLPARRTGWGHPVLRWTAYVTFTLGLAAVLVWIMIDVFHLG